MTTTTGSQRGPVKAPVYHAGFRVAAEATSIKHMDGILRCSRQVPGKSALTDVNSSAAAHPCGAAAIGLGSHGVVDVREKCAA